MNIEGSSALSSRRVAARTAIAPKFCARKPFDHNGTDVAVRFRHKWECSDCHTRSAKRCEHPRSGKSSALSSSLENETVPPATTMSTRMLPVLAVAAVIQNRALNTP